MTNKLEERFEEVAYDNLSMAGGNCAKEAKEIAIEFAEYITINYFCSVDLIEQEVTGYRLKTTRCTPKRTTKDLFNEFIEEKYGK